MADGLSGADSPRGLSPEGRRGRHGVRRPGALADGGDRRPLVRGRLPDMVPRRGVRNALFPLSRSRGASAERPRHLLRLSALRALRLSRNDFTDGRLSPVRADSLQMAGKSKRAAFGIQGKAACAADHQPQPLHALQPPVRNIHRVFGDGKYFQLLSAARHERREGARAHFRTHRRGNLPLL